MLQHATGNLLDMAENGLFDVIVHGANCLSTMGSGIAKEIKARYPEAYLADHNYMVHQSTIMKLGNYSFTETDYRHPNNQFIIVNAYTQHDYLPRGKDHFEYESFEIILRKLLVVYGDKNIGFPYIGMGLAGGASGRIINLITSFAQEVTKKGGTVTLVEFNG